MAAGVDHKKLLQHRAKTFRTNLDVRLKTAEEAIQFVNERGLILFHPAKEVVLPSLWTATAGDRPVPNEHDDPGHRSWTWKDEYLDKRVWYYGRLLHKRMSMISLAMLPYFYALSPNYGDFQNDYLLQYKAGKLSFECKNIYEALLVEGPLNTLELREKARLSGSKNQYLYSKSLNILQQEMKVMPIGVAAAGRWNYAFLLDIVPRYFPELEMQARAISHTEARVKILTCYFKSVGCASKKEISKIFFWSQKDVEQPLLILEELGMIGYASAESATQYREYGLTELLL